MEERKEAVIFRGKPEILLGPEIKVGQKAPDFLLLDKGMQEVKLASSRGKVRLLTTIYSVETPICDLQIRTFEEEVSHYPAMAAYVVSMDLPFTQARYTKEHNLKNIKLLSDYRTAEFAISYGMLIKESRLLARTVFIIDAQGIVRYVEYVKDVGQAPDYEKAAEAIKKINQPS